MHFSPAIIVESPGRINLIGEHTDYNDGFVLPAAIDKKCTVQLRENGTTSTVNIWAEDLEEHFSFDLKAFSRLASGWQNYVMGVVHELQQLGAQLRGFDASFGGDVPIGSGMSSSAALECSLAFGLDALFQLQFDRLQLIHVAQMAEHHFVGIQCGIMDQFASVMGRQGHVFCLDCRSLSYEHYPLSLGDYQVLLLNTNVSHTLAGSEYDTRRAECEEGVALLEKWLPEITHLRDVDLSQLAVYEAELPRRIYQRCHHVISENQRVLTALQALNAGALPQFGALMYASHRSLQHDYLVSCPELDFLVQLTQDLPYVLGSRMMGGGFGGCTINIVKKDMLPVFIETAAEQYRQTFGLDLTPYSVTLEDGTRVSYG